MPFDVQEYRAFIELLYKHPEWRAELRQLVLNEELLSLPQLVHELIEAHKRGEERLTRIEESLAELAEAQKRHEERLAGVEERLTRLENTVAELVEVQKRHEERLADVEERLAKVEERLEGVEERLTRLENIVAELAEAQKRTELQVQRLTDRMGQIVGDLLEIKYRDKPFSYFGRIVRRARTVDLAEVEDLLGEGLTQEQLFELLQLDLLVHGQLRQPRGERKEHPEVWLAIEVSSVVDREDVQRVARPAEILRQAGLPVLAVAAGGNLTPEARELARTTGVALQADGQLELLEEALAKLGE